MTEEDDTLPEVEALARALTYEDYSAGGDIDPIIQSSLTRAQIVAAKVESRWGERYERAEEMLAYLKTIGFTVAPL